MNAMQIVKSKLDPADAIYSSVIPAGEPWMRVIGKGQYFRIVDLRGNQAVDTLFYGYVDGRPDPALRYSAQATVAAQRNIFLTNGSVLRAADGTALMTIVADEVKPLPVSRAPGRAAVVGWGTLVTREWISARPD